MFSGKTEELIRRLIRAKIAKQNVTIFKPTLDDRYSEDYIVSHNNRQIKSLTIKNVTEIEKYSKKSDVIGIDEAQFFDLSLIEICKKLNLPAADIIRTNEKEYKDSNISLNDSDDVIINEIVRHPRLMERPIVIKENKGIIGRPPENVLKLL